MARLRIRSSRSGYLPTFLAFLHFGTIVSGAIVQQYCSTENTGSGTPETSIYQSNGHCSGVCKNSAFAVVQGQNCWCSDYAPLDTRPVSDCSSHCPGYPYELCGNTDTGYFGYVALQKVPVGTAAGPPGASATTSSPLPEPVTVISQIVNSVTVAITVTASPPPPSDSSPVVADLSTISTSSSTTDAPTTSTPVFTPTPITTTIINSVGSIVTVTTTPTLSANSDQLKQSGGSSGVSAGVVAAIVVSIVVALAVIIGALLWTLHRRKKMNQELLAENESLGGVQRMNSQMSRNGLIGGIAPVIRRQTSSGHTHEPGSSGSGGGGMLQRSNSRPLFYDQRLNPNALMIHEDRSRNSVNTIDDHRDYGRTLNVRNPDPDGNE